MDVRVERVDIDIERATAADGQSILRLLAENGLPLDGLLDHLDTAFVARTRAHARAEGRLVGCAALEIYPDGALLRSVAVDPSARGRGIGRALTDAAIAFARSLDLPAVFLLTTTAEHYFPKLGFETIPRDQVPAGVQQSVEFRSACPASAIVMKRPLAATPTRTRTVIFACVHNAGRSQMAAAFFNQLADPGVARAVSAGTQPGERVHPVVVEVMQEIGLDLTHNRPQKLTEALAQDATLLITMGCGDECPYVPGLARDDWPLPDPKGRPLDEVRHIRDEIRTRVSELLNARRWTAQNQRSHP
jgi:N-acetylglutamate synthase-like GNAT family acetyltransferase/protein-tyrosine-phosphatase